MKWILSLISLAVLSSCSTKPYMVGSVNEMFYKRYRTPGAGYRMAGEERQYDYTWQQHFVGTARQPIFPRKNKPHVHVHQEVYAPVGQPYTSGK
ncbi:hypothetical protein WJU23_21115 [Prosthecobacter sp. SYSU 5D2]|uniref:hypothetical protein n=1 Tax=Prosthecobacter sp. SYSU 5D2 TaxID=3134134 RepID=UPI0031FE84CE